jgi:hypothetical protein
LNRLREEVFQHHSVSVAAIDRARVALVQNEQLAGSEIGIHPVDLWVPGQRQTYEPLLSGTVHFGHGQSGEIHAARGIRTATGRPH